MVKIIDCFLFYNELDLLIYRINLLHNIVDYFVIVESTHTHVGKKKKMWFIENKHLFEPFSKKIIHIIVHDFPYKYNNINLNHDDVWKNENFQRNAISKGINCIKDLDDSDLIIIADLDEIPNPYTLNTLKKGNIIFDIHILEMDLYYYNLHTKISSNWPLCKILSYKKYNELNISCQDIRCNKTTSCKILNGGWHLSYFGDKEFIQNKIKNFAHQEYNESKYTNLENIETKIKNNIDLYDRNIKYNKIKIEDNTNLPVDYNKYLTKYYKMDV